MKRGSRQIVAWGATALLPTAVAGGLATLVSFHNGLTWKALLTGLALTGTLTACAVCGVGAVVGVVILHEWAKRGD